MCPYCFEIYVGEPGGFCDDCLTSECTGHGECLAPGAYGAEEIADERSPEDVYAGKE
jgi:hypothetical protein